ncbi:MAG: deoxynucleoside kinase, partial [Bacteroidia bacterium]
QSMSKHVNAPDLLIYLRADVEKLQQHIQKRGRDYEASISGQYLDDLNEHYEDWIANYQEGNVLIIDMNKLDYVNNAADMAWVIQTVEKSLENTEIAVAKG